MNRTKRGIPARLQRAAAPAIAPSALAPIQSAVAARFWSKVDQRGPDDCWNWTRCLTTDGYGKFSVGRKTFRAHRIAYEMFVGPVPDDIEVCHSCDNRLCCNLNHLWLGTNQQNLADMSSKGRRFMPRGDLHPRAKLTADQVRVIRSAGDPPKHLAAAYGVSERAIRDAIDRTTWSHVP